MKKSEAFVLFDRAAAEQRLLKRSVETYRGCLERWWDWMLRDHSRFALSPEDRVSAYLSEKAPNWAAATQDQALNALVWFHKHALQKPLGILPAWARAERPKRLPVWLTHKECLAVLGQMRDPNRLACELMYGAGFRITEVARLRRKDINWRELTIVVRDGKGEKDRVTCLPVSLVEKLREQDEYAAGLWAQDRRDNVGPVWMPDSVLRKYPNRGLEEGEYWLLPARGLARGAQCGNVRHHICADTLSKAIPIATKRARVLKHVKAHVFRHSFATEYLQNGGVITDLQNLLGHTQIETTMIYTHCLPKLAARIQSPLDRQTSNVVLFQASQFSERRTA